MEEKYILTYKIECENVGFIHYAHEYFYKLRNKFTGNEIVYSNANRTYSITINNEENPLERYIDIERILNLLNSALKSYASNIGVNYRLEYTVTQGDLVVKHYSDL